MKQVLKYLAGIALATSLAPAALAALLPGNTYAPLITAGGPPDAPAAHVDANTAASPYSGVVSINIRYDGQSFICSGTLVSRRHIVTAAHCVDTNGQGQLIDLNKAGSDVRAVFNSNGTFNALINASTVSMHPDYHGFGVCPPGVNSFCVNDDVAVITLAEDAPASARSYSVWAGAFNAGRQLTMAGYGTSGDGWNGFNISPSFFVKRTGGNVVDLFDLDDEQGFAGNAEVWYADFDGVDRNGNLQDAFCQLGLACSPILPNDRESGIGGGDSGGASFIEAYGNLVLAANNTFGGDILNSTKGAFGSFFGGILLNSYTDYLVRATDGRLVLLIPEPGTSALVVLGLLAAVGSRRRSSTQRA